MDKFLLRRLIFFSVCFLSIDASKVGCLSYETTGQVVAGGSGYGPALNQFFTDRFYVDESQNIYLLDRSSSYLCEWRFLLWPRNSSKGSFITNACVNGVPSSTQDVLVSTDGTYKITGLGYSNDVVAQVRRVNGQNSFMVWSKTIVDNDKNIYSLGYSTSSRSYELWKWTVASLGRQDGILIASDVSIWGISDFFVDIKGSVYMVGPRDVVIRNSVLPPLLLLAEKLCFLKFFLPFFLSFLHFKDFSAFLKILRTHICNR